MDVPNDGKTYIILTPYGQAPLLPPNACNVTVGKGGQIGTPQEAFALAHALITANRKLYDHPRD